MPDPSSAPWYAGTVAVAVGIVALVARVFAKRSDETIATIRTHERYLEKEIDEVRKDNKLLRAEIAELRGRFEQIMVMLNQKDATIADLRIEMDKVKAHCADEIKAKDEVIHDLTGELTRVKTELRSFKAPPDPEPVDSVTPIKFSE